jgi:hypothetical protein
MHAGSSPVVADSTGGFTSFDETKHRRIQNVKVNGKPIQKNTMYTIAGTEEFLTKSAAGSAFFGTDHFTGKDMTDSEALITYLTDEKQLNKVIPSSLYKATTGRIKILKDTDADAHRWGEATPESGAVKENGNHEHTCEFCGKTEKEKHNFIVKSTTEPTLEEKGTITKVCTECQAELTVEMTGEIGNETSGQLSESQIKSILTADELKLLENGAKITVELTVEPDTQTDAGILSEMSDEQKKNCKPLTITLTKQIGDAAEEEITELTGGKSIEVEVDLSTLNIPDPVTGATRTYTVFNRHGTEIIKPAFTVKGSKMKITISKLSPFAITYADELSGTPTPTSTPNPTTTTGTPTPTNAAGTATPTPTSAANPTTAPSATPGASTTPNASGTPGATSPTGSTTPTPTGLTRAASVTTGDTPVVRFWGWVFIAAGFMVLILGKLRRHWS